MYERCLKLLKQFGFSKRHIVYGGATIFVLLLSSVSLFRLSPYHPSAGYSQYFRGKVLAVTPASSEELGSYLDVRVRLLDGPDKNSVQSLQYVLGIGDTSRARLPVGSQLLISLQKETHQYFIVARWYMPGIATLFVILLLLILTIGAWRGITSVLGLAISILILAAFVVPRIVDGHGAFITCIEAAVMITVVSIYVAHGVSKRTTIAFIGSLVSLGVVVGLTAFASYVTGTSDVIDESNVNLLYGHRPIDLAGLVTGGIVIASLGALFDITTGQAATVDELHKANRKQTSLQLFWRGMSVGREHIAALINTLALVYAGVALTSIVSNVVLAQNATYAHVPLLVRANTEVLAEEIMRTCVTSIAMILALPITTMLAAYVLPRWAEAVAKKQNTAH